MAKRLYSIDFLRGLAVVFMIQTHLWGALIADPRVSKGWLFEWIVFPLGGFAAPLFIIVSGFSSFLLVNSLLTSGNDNVGIRKIFFNRGLFLFLLSSMVNLVAGSFLNMQIKLLSWSVFQLIGVAFFIVPFFYTQNFIVKLFFTLLPLIISEIGGTPQKILPNLFEGFTPFFPWVSLFFSGYILGIISYNQIFRKIKIDVFLCLVGLLILFPVKYVLEVNNQPFNNWDKSLGMNFNSYFVYIGFFILLVQFFYYFLDKQHYNNQIINFLYYSVKML